MVWYVALMAKQQAAPRKKHAKTRVSAMVAVG